MKAIILAAGQGTRLRPYTDERPKCLVELGGKALLDHQIASLRAAGIDDICVATGYRSDLIDAMNSSAWYCIMPPSRCTQTTRSTKYHRPALPQATGAAADGHGARSRPSRSESQRAEGGTSSCAAMAHSVRFACSSMSASGVLRSAATPARPW